MPNITMSSWFYNPIGTSEFNDQTVEQSRRNMPIVGLVIRPCYLLYGSIVKRGEGVVYVSPPISAGANENHVLFLHA